MSLKWVELLKEKSQHIQFGNGEFIKRLEPQVREIRESINHSMSNSFASEWLSRWLTVANEEVCTPEVISPAVKALHMKLQPKVGSELHCSEWYPICQRQIDQFAEVTGDKQWLHIDLDRARKDSPFKSTIAHGMLILSLIPKLRSINSDEDYQSGKFVMNCGVGDVNFHAPVKPGQSIRLRALLRRVTPAKRHLEITEEITIELENSLRRACTATITMKVYI